jgi:hypothetical protein
MGCIQRVNCKWIEVDQTKLKVQMHLTRVDVSSVSVLPDQHYDLRKALKQAPCIRKCGGMMMVFIVLLLGINPSPSSVVIHP